MDEAGVLELVRFGLIPPPPPLRAATVDALGRNVVTVRRFLLPQPLIIMGMMMQMGEQMRGAMDLFIVRGAGN